MQQLHYAQHLAHTSGRAAPSLQPPTPVLAGNPVPTNGNPAYPRQPPMSHHGQHLPPVPPYYPQGYRQQTAPYPGQPAPLHHQPSAAPSAPNSVQNMAAPQAPVARPINPAPRTPRWRQNMTNAVQANGNSALTTLAQIPRQMLNTFPGNNTPQANSRVPHPSSQPQQAPAISRQSVSSFGQPPPSLVQYPAPQNGQYQQATWLYESHDGVPVASSSTARNGRYQAALTFHDRGRNSTGEDGGSFPHTSPVAAKRPRIQQSPAEEAKHHATATTPQVTNSREGRPLGPRPKVEGGREEVVEGKGKGKENVPLENNRQLPSPSTSAGPSSSPSPPSPPEDISPLRQQIISAFGGGPNAGSRKKRKRSAPSGANKKAANINKPAPIEVSSKSTPTALRGTLVPPRPPVLQSVPLPPVKDENELPAARDFAPTMAAPPAGPFTSVLGLTSCLPSTPPPKTQIFLPVAEPETTLEDLLAQIETYENACADVLLQLPSSPVVAPGAPSSAPSPGPADYPSSEADADGEADPDFASPADSNLSEAEPLTASAAFAEDDAGATWNGLPDPVVPKSPKRAPPERAQVWVADNSPMTCHQPLCANPLHQRWAMDGLGVIPSAVLYDMVPTTFAPGEVVDESLAAYGHLEAGGIEWEFEHVFALPGRAGMDVGVQY